MAKLMVWAGIVVLSFTSLVSTVSANTNSEILMPSPVSLNTKTEFIVRLNQIPQATSLTNRISFEGGFASDINSLEYWNSSQWVNMPVSQSPTGVISGVSNFVTTSMSYRISVNTNRVYVIGYSLENSNTGGVLSSSAVVMNTTGNVLGESKFVFHKNLRYGNRNSDVTELQKVFIAQGFLSGTPNGVFDSKTFVAAKKYQRANGVPSTGFVGPLTRAKLNQ